MASGAKGGGKDNGGGKGGRNGGYLRGQCPPTRRYRAPPTSAGHGRQQVVLLENQAPIPFRPPAERDEIGLATASHAPTVRGGQADYGYSFDRQEASPSRRHDAAEASCLQALIGMQYTDRGLDQLFSQQSESLTKTTSRPIDPVEDDVDDEPYNSADEHEAEEADASREQDTTTRGPNRGCTIILTAHGDELFHHRTGRCMDLRLPRKMTIAIRGHLSGGVWPTWSAVPHDVRDLMCQDWMDQIDFRPDELHRARRAFYITAGARMRSLMYYARKKAKTVAQTSSIAECIDGHGRPTWLSQEVWAQLIRDHWGSSAFTSVSDRAKRSRNTEVNGVRSRHTSGLVPFEVRERLLSAKKQRPVRFDELFDETHRFTDDQYSDGRAEHVLGAYKAAMKAKYGEDETVWPFIDERIYFETFGPAKRGRYYGLGSGGIGACTVRSGRSLVASLYFNQTSAPIAVPNGSYQEDLRTQVADLQAQLKDMASFQREQIVEHAMTSGSAPSQEEFDRRVHEAFQREITTYQSQLDVQIEQRFEARAKKVEEERQKAEEQRRKDDEERLWSHMHSLDSMIESRFTAMQSRLDSTIESRFTVMQSSLLRDIAGLLKISQSDAFASSSHSGYPPLTHD